MNEEQGFTEKDLAQILKLISTLNRRLIEIREELDNFRIIFKDNINHFVAYLEEIFERLKKLTNEAISLRKKEEEETKS